MLNKNQLTHAVIWPAARSANLSLSDIDGEVVAQIPVKAPLKGADLARLIPDGYQLLPEECHVVSLSGEVLVNVGVKFDTTVVVERAEVTFEDRMARLERRERRRDKREKLLQAQLDAALAERDAVAELASVPDPVDDPQDDPESNSDDGGDTDA